MANDISRHQTFNFQFNGEPAFAQGHIADVEARNSVTVMLGVTGSHTTTLRMHPGGDLRRNCPADWSWRKRRRRRRHRGAPPMSDALQTTDTDLQVLRRAVDVARETRTEVIVNKEALRRLLNDHHTLWTVSRRKGNWQPGEDQVSLT